MAPLLNVALLRTGSTHVGEAPRVDRTVWVHGRGNIYMGDRVVFDATDASIELLAARGATLVVPAVGASVVLARSAPLEVTALAEIVRRLRRYAAIVRAAIL
jgi:hypothetical protein